MRITSKKGAPGEARATADDWRRLRQALLHARARLDLRWETEADAPERILLLQERAQLAALLQLCETLAGQADQREREVPTDAGVPPKSPGLAAFHLQINAAKLHAMRAAHTVLVVDDHEPTRYVATRLLQRAGYKVMEAATGEEALLHAYEACALLLDVNLPDVNGVEVCQVIKEHSRAKPVVLMSAIFTDEFHRGAGISAGADLYLTSFLDGEQLARSFDRLLAPQTR